VAPEFVRRTHGHEARDLADPHGTVDEPLTGSALRSLGVIVAERAQWTPTRLPTGRTPVGPPAP